MHVASAIAAVCFKCLRFRLEKRRDHRRIRPVECFGQSNNGIAGGLAVVGSERYIALAIAQRHDFSDIVLAALFLFLAQGLGRLAQRSAGQTRLAGVH